MNVDRWLGPERGAKGCKSKAATVRIKQDCRKGLRMASKGSQIRNTVQACVAGAGAGVPLRIDQTLGDSETRRITRNEAQSWRD